MQELQNFGTLLKRYRLEVGLSQEALAERAGVSARAISDLERGTKRTPRFETLDLLTSALALSPHQRTLLHALARPELSPAAEPEQKPALLPKPPLAPSPLIGREQEYAQARTFLADPSVRLLTVLGPGGIGKTRLAAQLAHDLVTHFRDGSAFVALAPIHDPAVVPELLGQSFGLHEQVELSMAEQVRSFLASKHLLLVLDNFEHLLVGASFVADLLASCPQLAILVTSRSPLRIRAEHVFPLLPLTEAAAAAFFQDRVESVRPGLTYDSQLVSAICERLDRLPLAIELAAMQVRALSLTELQDRLTNRLAFLRGGATDLPARQQTMASAIAWSYELLTPAQQRGFRALGVFVGGWTLAAAKAVCGAEDRDPLEEPVLLHAALVDASLIKVELPDQQAARFTMLEVIREYALARLREAGEEEVYRQRHAAYFASVAEHVTPFGQGQGTGETNLSQEFPNARAALEWAATRNEKAVGLRLVAGFGRIWMSHDRLHEAERWLERLLPAENQMEALQPTLYALQADALALYGELLQALGKWDRAHELATEAIDRAEHQEDHGGLSTAYALLGQSAIAQGKLSEAELYFTKSAAHAKVDGGVRNRGRARLNLAELARLQGDFIKATALYEESLAALKAIGLFWGVGGVTMQLGLIAYQQGKYALAKARFRESLALYREFGSRTFTAWCLESIAAVLCAEGQYGPAARLCGAAVAFREEANTPLPPSERDAFAETVQASRTGLGGTAFEQEWATGAALTLQAAIDYALIGACPS